MTLPKRIFTVNGKPFLPLGGQSSTSSAYSSSEIEPAFKAVNLLHGNTLLTDVYWSTSNRKKVNSISPWLTI